MQGGLAARSGTEFRWSPQLRNLAEWDWVPFSFKTNMAEKADMEGRWVFALFWVFPRPNIKKRFSRTLLMEFWDIRRRDVFRAEKRSAQASALPLSQAQGGLFCVLTVQFVCLWLREFWLRLNEMHKVWTFAPRKAFLLLCGFCFSSLENYFGLGTTNVKGKTDHSVSLRWNKEFWTFPKRRVFFWLFIRFICELISPSFAGLN